MDQTPRYNVSSEGFCKQQKHSRLTFVPNGPYYAHITRLSATSWNLASSSQGCKTGERRSSHTAWYFHGHPKRFPDAIVAPKLGVFDAWWSDFNGRSDCLLPRARKRDVFQTLTGWFLARVPKQSMSTELWQRGKRKFNLNKHEGAAWSSIHLRFLRECTWLKFTLVTEVAAALKILLKKCP